MVNIYDCKRVLWHETSRQQQKSSSIQREATKATESADTSSSPWQSAQVCTKNGGVQLLMTGRQDLLANKAMNTSDGRGAGEGKQKL